MQKRDRKIRRIAAVQARLHRIAEWNLMECQSREIELEDKQRRILEAFNDESKLQDLLVQTAGKSLRAASVEQAAVAKVKERLAENTRTEGRKLKHVERLVDLANGRAAKEDEKRTLDDEIDQAVRRLLQKT
jgi:NADP-dependent 3-hydroxy acid dehydrogenase YdfG